MSWVYLYAHSNVALVRHAQDLLQREGIQVWLKNEYAAAGAGDLAPMDTDMQIWVSEEDEAFARQVLHDLIHPPKHTPADWICHNCGEANGVKFELCWLCTALRRE